MDDITPILIGIVLCGILWFAGIFIIFDEAEDEMSGCPTYEGMVMDMELDYHWQDRTTIQLDDGTVFQLVGINHNIKINHTYQFWVNGHQLWEYKEIEAQSTREDDRRIEDEQI